MKERTYLLNLLLAGLVGMVCLALVLVQALLPYVLIPKAELPVLVLLTAVPLAAEHYIGAPKKREWIGSTVLAGLTFSVLPACAGVTGGMAVWQLFVYGCIVFAVTTILYTSMSRRMASGPRAKAAPIVNALLLVLAMQFFQGLI